jgi:hypothetical protein|tara:strand:+ start:609 stop:851 length:243 start_codon:yes stop_codon:yes gene_type:complete
MIHKISEFCDKVDSIKSMADRLRNMKYGPVKSSKGEIDNMIQSIQADCLLVANDKGEYEKNNYGDYSGIDHDGVFINEKE